jgi:sec-independent protein translocase protein TatA
MIMLLMKSKGINIKRKRGDHMFGFGLTEIIIITLLLVLFFGGRKIPELTRGITESIREFKKGAKDED